MGNKESIIIGRRDRVLMRIAVALSLVAVANLIYESKTVPSESIIDSQRPAITVPAESTPTPQTPGLPTTGQVTIFERESAANLPQ